VCMAVATDPLNIFDNFDINAITDWLLKNWWVVLATVGGIVVIIIAIRCTYKVARPRQNQERNAVAEQQYRSRQDSVHHGGQIKRNDSTFMRLRRDYFRRGSAQGSPITARAIPRSGNAANPVSRGANGGRPLSTSGNGGRPLSNSRNGGRPLSTVQSSNVDNSERNRRSRNLDDAAAIIAQKEQLELSEALARSRTEY